MITSKNVLEYEVAYFVLRHRSILGVHIIALVAVDFRNMGGHHFFHLDFSAYSS